jgi:hypothetical protein
MKCKYCSGRIALLRKLTDREFCSDSHRYAFFQLETRDSSASSPVPQSPALETEPAAPVANTVADNSADTVAAAVSMPADPAAAQNSPPSQSTPDAKAPRRAKRRDALTSGRWLVAAWKTAPVDLKALALLLPVLVALIFSPALPKLRARFAAPAHSGLRARTRQALSERWKIFAQRISNRAAIAITDDFRSGLDGWQSRSNLTKSWSFDANGFVQPGPLAILQPTQDLTDYSFEFLGEIEQRAMGCAFRAQDLDNYYALKFEEENLGTLPSIKLVRYAVIDGKEGPRVEKLLPSGLRADMMNRFHVEVHGDDFTIMSQGEVLDFFSDSRLKSGGVGFFCARGEKARLRWVEVSHQYDTLGKLCAYLAPISLAGVGKD